MAARMGFINAIRCQMVNIGTFIKYDRIHTLNMIVLAKMGKGGGSGLLYLKPRASRNKALVRVCQPLPSRFSFSNTCRRMNLALEQITDQGDNGRGDNNPAHPFDQKDVGFDTGNVGFQFRAHLLYLAPERGLAGLNIRLGGDTVRKGFRQSVGGPFGLLIGKACAFEPLREFQRIKDKSIHKSNISVLTETGKKIRGNRCSYNALRLGIGTKHHKKKNRFSLFGHAPFCARIGAPLLDRDGRAQKIEFTVALERTDDNRIERLEKTAL